MGKEGKEMKILQNLMKRFEGVMVAATFAEAGEFETAREIMREQSQQQKKVSKRKQSYHAPKIQNRLKT